MNNCGPQKKKGKLFLQVTHVWYIGFQHKCFQVSKKVGASISWGPRKVVTAQQPFAIDVNVKVLARGRSPKHFIYIIFCMVRVFIYKSKGQQSRQLCSTIAETLFSYSRLFSWYSCAAWLFAGLLGFGSSSSDCIEVRIEDTS